MKKLVLALICITGFAFAGNAQEIPENALGLRLGGGNGFGAEFTYQRHLEANNRIQADLGIRSKSDFSAFRVLGLYQWVWQIDRAFNWYAGAGPGIGVLNDKRSHDRRGDDGLYGVIAGNVGIEYHFDIPLQLFVDFRPEFALANYDVFTSFGPDFALGARYRF